jgi:hypothetical protein
MDRFYHTIFHRFCKQKIFLRRELLFCPPQCRPLFSPFSLFPGKTLLTDKPEEKRLRSFLKSAIIKVLFMNKRPVRAGLTGGKFYEKSRCQH